VQELLSDSFWPVVILLGLTLLGAFLTYLIRRWAKQSEVEAPTGFALSDLRKLHKAGKMSDEEFKKASLLVTQAHAAQLLSPAEKEPGLEGLQKRPRTPRNPLENPRPPSEKHE
jgi:hypothetical protein